MTVVIRLGSADLRGLRLAGDGHESRLLGSAHDIRAVPPGVLQHAFGCTHLEHRVADMPNVHAVADLDTQGLGKLPVSDHAGFATSQCEGDGQDDIARRREVSGRRRRRRVVHARFQRAHTVSETQVARGQIPNGTLLAVPYADDIDAGADLLAVCADVLHHGRADGAGDARQSLDALQFQFDASIHEIVPVAPRFGGDEHDFLFVPIADVIGFTRHGHVSTRVAHHHALERRVGHQHVGSAANDAQRFAFRVGDFDRIDEVFLRSRFEERCDRSSHTDGGEICKTSHSAPE